MLKVVVTVEKQIMTKSNGSVLWEAKNWALKYCLISHGGKWQLE
jgi:hypothetical protein